MTPQNIELRQEYSQRGYALIEQLFSPLLLQIFHGKMQQDLQLRESTSFVATNPLLTKPALEVYSRQYAPMATFHWGLTAAIADIANCDLVPTYAYFRVYQRGDICLIHSDRHACEHSVSLTVELADELPWALSVESRKIDRPEAPAREFGDADYGSLSMKSGDAVIYRGVEHRHGRTEPNPNRWSAHLFMHWVDSNGPHADHAFDRVMLEKHGMPA